MNKNGMQTPPAMEAFEQRLLLAGDVTAVVTNAGDLVITGDDAANIIIVTEAGGTITITRNDADTSVNGDADVGLAGVVIDGTFSRHIKIKMGDGDDVVEILGDDGGDGPGGLADTLFAIGGNVQIDLGAGSEVATVQDAKLDLVDVAGSIKITSKDDNDADARIEDSTVGKNVQIALYGGDNFASIDSVDIGGNLKIANKNGDQVVELYSSTVDGSVSIANGKGLYVVEVQDSMIGKNLSIKNKELVTADPASRQEILIWDTDVAGSVRISNGKGATYVSIDDNNAGDMNGATVTIGKNLSITSKDGDDYIYVNDTTAANIQINAGKGGNGTTEVGVAYVTTTGSLSMANKSGKSDLKIGYTTVTKKTILTGGKAQTTVDIGNLVATGGLQIKGGGKEAADTLRVTAIALTSSKVKIQGGAAVNTITLDDIILDSLQLKTGAGADFINIETLGIGTIGGGGVISTVGTVKISTGDGDDTVTAGQASQDARGLTITGKGKLDGGKGAGDLLDVPIASGNVYDLNLISDKNFETVVV